MKKRLRSIAATASKLFVSSVAVATATVSASAAIASSDARAVTAVTYDCHFTQWTNGINPVTETATLLLTPGAQPAADLLIGDYKASVDMYWLADASGAVGINLSIWHNAADKQETSTHTDSLDAKVGLHMQSSAPEFFDFQCVQVATGN